MLSRFDTKSSFLFSCFISLLVFFLISVPFSTGFRSVDESSLITKDELSLVFDCTKTKGYINDFSEINCGPIPNPGIEGVDLISQFRKTGFDFVRNHDFIGPTDISMIFPNMSKDPLEPSNYNFTISDQYIKSIIDAGCDVFYRLGESANTEEKLRQPPENKSKWAEICKHIVMHYNDGWADGFQYNISYWEIWNEPDLSGFWNGTTEQYYELYQEAAVILKEYDPTIKVGGPCTSSIFNKNFTTRFLSFVNEHQIPLDFYSWHMYADTPFQLYNGSKLVRTLLDSFGFYDTESINTEWNINILTPQRDKDNAKNAAFTACCLSIFQDAGIDHAFRYRATQDNNPLVRFIGFDLSLFSYDGLFKTPALSYLAFHYMIDQTPIRLQSPTVDAQQQVTCLSGISKDKTNISLLLSNFDLTNKEYEIIIKNIPWNSTYTITYYLIDDSHHLQIIDQFEETSSTLKLKNDLLSSSVQFVRITNSSILPEEGPVPSEIPWFLRFPLFDPLAKILGFLFMLIFFG
ncbi:MAG TPA: hypothetical protein VKP59_07085 [Candidatus Thermoplasmatota archaeon]|nr:hypothetical protein [Candidatus Thermoplasmatota archaeon]